MECICQCTQLHIPGDPQNIRLGNTTSPLMTWDYGNTGVFHLSLSLLEVMSVVDGWGDIPNTCDFKQRSIVLSNAITPPPFPPLPSSSHRWSVGLGEKKKKEKEAFFVSMLPHASPTEKLLLHDIQECTHRLLKAKQKRMNKQANKTKMLYI